MAEDQPPVSGSNRSSDDAVEPAGVAPAALGAAPADADALSAAAPVEMDAAGAAGDALTAALDAGAPVPDIDQAAIDDILNQASFEDASQAMGGADIPVGAGVPLPAGAQELELPNFQQVMQEAQVSSIDLLRDVDLNVKIELGRSRMLVEDVLKLGEGSVVELDKLAGDPVDVFVNERLIARGEVLVLNDNFCVRINEIVAGVKEEGL